MCLTGASSFQKSALSQIDYDPGQFKGWGFEDTMLGANIIARGAYIIPMFNSPCLAVRHRPRSGSQKEKMEEFDRNRKIYNHLIASININKEGQ